MERQKIESYILKQILGNSNTDNKYYPDAKFAIIENIENYNKYNSIENLKGFTIVFSKTVFEDIISISNIDYKYENLIFENCVFNESFEFKANTKEKFHFIFLNNKVLKGDLIISNNSSTYISIIISKTQINGNLNLIGNINSIEILNKTKISNSFNFTQGQNYLIENINFQDCTLGEEFNLEVQKVNNIEISNISVGKDFSLKGNSNTNEISNIRLKKIKTKGQIKFENLLVQKDFINSDLETTQNINFKNVKISNNLKFSGVLNKTNTLILDSSNSTETLSFESKWENKEPLEFNIYCKSFYINETSFDVDCNIEILNSDILFIEGAIFKTLKIINSNFKDQIKIESSKIFGDLGLLNTTSGSLFFNNNAIEGKTFINNKTIQSGKIEQIFIENSYFNEDFYTTKLFCQILSFEDCIFKRKLNLTQTNISDFLKLDHSLNFEQIILNEKCEIYNFTLSFTYVYELVKENAIINSEKIIFENCHIYRFTPNINAKFEFIYKKCILENIRFEDLTNVKDVTYSFINSEIGNLSFLNFNNLGQIFFRKINPINEKSRLTLKENFTEADEIKFWIRNIYNHYKDSLKTEKPKVQVNINFSSLGKTEFLNFDFENIPLKYNNSKLIETTITGKALPKNVEILDNEANSETFHYQKVEVYNQLKKIFDNQGDIIQSNFFNFKAAEAYSKLLNKRFKNLFSKDTVDIITNFFNRISNNYGENWFQALIFTFGVGLLFFTLYVNSKNEFEYYSLLTYEFSIDKESLKYLPEFFNPTHRSDFLESDKLKRSLSMGIYDILGRIFIGFGIYQFIVAFRKNGKKSS